MNFPEAKAVSLVLRWLTGDRDVTVQEARDRAGWLARRSHEVLAAGITQEQIAERWLPPTATDPSTMPAETVTRIGRVIEQWLDGDIAPQDALGAIRTEVGDR